MRSDDVSHLVTDVVEQHVPDRQPPFEVLVARWRRRRAVRLVGVAIAVVVAVAIAVPAVLLHKTGGPDPQIATSAPGSAGRPTGRIPWDVTGVSACRGTDCRTVTDIAQVHLLVGDLNLSGPYRSSHGGSCEPDPAGITLTFTGPNQPYPIVDVMIQCDWWAIRGEPQRFEAFQIRETAQQAQRHGIVVHDCGVTSGYFGREYWAPDFVGRTLDDATGEAARRGYEIRVLGQDGTCAGAVTDDFRASDRVNLYLEGGRVKTAAYG